MQKRIRGMALASAMAFMAFAAYAENVSISTYYPSPYGSYQTVETTTNTSLATTSGNVGIGVAGASAGEKLHVAGNALIGGTGSLRVVSLDANTANLRPGVAGGDLILSDDSAVVTGGMVIAEGGNIAIGKNATAFKLDVAGNANFDGTLTLCDSGTPQECGILRVDCNGTSCWPVYAA